MLLHRWAVTSRDTRPNGIVWTRGRCPVGTMRPKWAFSCISGLTPCPVGHILNVCYSVKNAPYRLGYVNEWFWKWWQRNQTANDVKIDKFMRDFYPPGFSYHDFGRDLKMEFFNASRIADLVRASGAKYFVFTSKHHDGFANWPSTFNYGWNSMDVGPHINVLGELKRAFDGTDIKFGLYYSLYEWFHPLYLGDRESGFKTRAFPDEKVLPELKELVETFEPEVVWSDGDWEADDVYWGSKYFLSWLYNDSPVRETVVTNDRWGRGTRFKRGDFYVGPDRYSPGHLVPHKWENAMTVDGVSWGYRRDMKIEDVLLPEELIAKIVTTVSCGGNILINVGPTKEGTIAAVFEERLAQIGGWLGSNGEAIYGTSPWLVQNDSSNAKVWYTQKNGDVYAILLDWPDDEVAILGSPRLTPETRMFMVGMRPDRANLAFQPLDDGAAIKMPLMSQLLKDCPWCQWAYVIRMTNLANEEAGYDDVESLGIRREIFNPNRIEEGNDDEADFDDRDVKALTGYVKEYKTKMEAERVEAERQKQIILEADRQRAKRIEAERRRKSTAKGTTKTTTESSTTRRSSKPSTANNGNFRKVLSARQVKIPDLRIRRGNDRISFVPLGFIIFSLAVISYECFKRFRKKFFKAFNKQQKAQSHKV